MQEMTNSPTPGESPSASSWRMRLAVVLLLLVAAGTVLITNRWLSERFTETTRNRAELRVALYSGNVISELQRTSVVPLLLAADPAMPRPRARATSALRWTGSSIP